MTTQAESGGHDSLAASVRRMPRPVFLLGISPRCGTNYLMDLLMLHAACCRVETVWEDYLVAQLDTLDLFVESVAGGWRDDWDPAGAARRQLRAHLAAGLLEFLRSLASERGASMECVVSKSPTVKNLDRFLDWFPAQKLIVAIRDGRDVVESSVRTFGWPFDAACRRWARGAARISEARDAGCPFLLVRYEDIHLQPETGIARVLAFLELDPARYDFAQATRLPVRGSSTFGREGAVHWEPLEKTSAFRPLRRWQHWTAEQHATFRAIAGEWHAAFGYEDDAGGGGGA